MNFQNVLKNFSRKNYLEALKDLDQLLIIEPQSVEKINLKGVILQFLKKNKEARESWVKASNINNSYFDPYFNLGNSYMEDKKYDLAEKYYKEAVRCEPNNFKIFYQLGLLYMKKEELKKSFNFFFKSKDINKSFAPTYYNLGTILNSLNRKKDSIIYFNEAIKIKPKYVEAYFSLGTVYREMKDFKLSKKFFSKAIQIDPNYPYLKGALRFVKNNLCEWGDYKKDLAELEIDIENHKKVVTPWQGLSLFSSPVTQFKNAKLFIENKKLISNPITLGREKINLAYFSANFCEHAVSNQLSEILKLHDKEKFNIFGFYLDTKEDSRLLEVKNYFTKFFSISDKSNDYILKLVNDLDVDIAIDLMGFTKNNKHEIFNKRCAPIQVSYLGFAGTTGLRNMDYLIADKNIITNEHRKYYSEKIVYMPDSFMPNNQSQTISKKKNLKKDLGLPNDSIVYCCFNKHYKITPEIFNLWVNILNNVENSVLWLNSAEQQTKENIYKHSEKMGLNPKRIFFTDRSKNYSDYLSKHKLADIFLDTSPFSAHSTGCGSLIAGVPIITLAGKTYANNVCSSLLKAIDMDELVSKNTEEYKRKAIDLGNDTKKLLKIKEKIKNKSIEKNLFNSKIYTQNLEKAYKKIYEIKINNLGVRDFYIT